MFKLKYVFYTLLNAEEIEQTLSKHILNGNIDNSQVEAFYTGSIDEERHEFTLFRITDEGGNDRIRPQIFGHYYKWKLYTKVEIVFTVPGTGSLKYLLLFLAGIIFVWGYFLNFAGPDPLIYIVPIFIVATFLFGALDLYSKCSGNLMLLKKILHNVDIQEP